MSPMGYPWESYGTALKLMSAHDRPTGPQWGAYERTAENQQKSIRAHGRPLEVHGIPRENHGSLSRKKPTGDPRTTRISQWKPMGDSWNTTRDWNAMEIHVSPSEPTETHVSPTEIHGSPRQTHGQTMRDP